MTWSLHVSGHTDDASKEASILQRVRELLGTLARDGHSILGSSFTGGHTGTTTDLHAVATTPAAGPTDQAPLASVPDVAEDDGGDGDTGKPEAPAKEAADSAKSSTKSSAKEG